MSRKKIQQPVEIEAVDKMDHFLATNYKKLLTGMAVLLVIFVAGYAFKNVNQSKNDMLTNKAGQLELLMTMSGGDKAKLDSYLAMANEYPKVGDYINLKAAEILISGSNLEAAKEPLNTVGGDLKELADGLKFDSGLGKADIDAYKSSGRLSSVWYYRACLVADDAKRAELIKEFGEKYPSSKLYEQIKRWNS